MGLAIDKQYHIAIGVVSLIGLIAVREVELKFGLGPALAFTSTLMGLAIESYQWARKEGTPDPYDFAATASPGWAAWAVLAALHWR